MDLNLVVLAGRVAAPPEHRTLDEAGTGLLRLLVTVRSDSPRRRIDVLPVTLWEPDDDLIGQPIAPGERVWVAGSVQRRFWEGSDGRRSRVEVVAHHVQRADEVGSMDPASPELA